jgi:hypothetical protein
MLVNDITSKLMAVGILMAKSTIQVLLLVQMLDSIFSGLDKNINATEKATLTYVLFKETGFFESQTQNSIVLVPSTITTALSLACLHPRDKELTR